jgi:hypothetical protein
MVRPPALPRAATATVGTKPKTFLNARYPEITRSHSSGTGRPMMPNINKKKIPK